MEIKAILKKPYTEIQKIDFIVENNHSFAYKIVETENSLEAWGNTEEETLQNENQQKSLLRLTAADVERALFKAFNKDFDDIVAMVNELKPEGLNIKELKIELKSNNFYRGNTYVSKVGELLGITPKQLDEFFATNDYTKLCLLPNSKISEGEKE